MHSPAGPRGFRERLASGERLVGTFVTLPGAAFAELVGSAFDYVCVDLEHSALGAAELQDAAIGAQAAGAAAVARVPAASDLLPAALDCGIDGIVAPAIDDAEAARSLVARTRYPDGGGTRGFGPRRTARRPAAEPVVIVQIESSAGVEHAREIAAVDGVDALLIGSSDLSFDLGVPHALDDERLRAAVSTVRDAARAAGRAFGLAGSLERGSLGAELEDSATLLALGTDASLCAAAFEQAVAGRSPGEDPEMNGATWST